MPSGRPKGGKNNYHSKEEKIKNTNKHKIKLNNSIFYKNKTF